MNNGKIIVFFCQEILEVPGKKKGDSPFLFPMKSCKITSVSDRFVAVNQREWE